MIVSVIGGRVESIVDVDVEGNETSAPDASSSVICVYLESGSMKQDHDDVKKLGVNQTGMSLGLVERQ